MSEANVADDELSRLTWEVDARVDFEVWHNKMTIPNNVWYYGWYYSLSEQLANGYKINSSRGPYETRRSATIACMKDKLRRERQRIKEGYKEV